MSEGETLVALSNLLDRRRTRAPSRAGLRVLLVDDNDVFLAAATAFLDELPGIGGVELACSGAEAIAFAAHYAPDLVLMDHHMPSATGIEAMRAIKSRPPAPRVVIMTVDAAPLLAPAALAAGADGFVAKEEFFERVPAVIERLFGAPRGRMR